MSLKVFHIIFITLSTVLAFAFSAWLVRSFSESGDIMHLLGGAISSLAGVAMIIYSIRFRRKLKNVNII